jgi:hypothetical protein
MNTNQLTALGTGPPVFFVSDEMSHAEPLYVHEIVNHTHSIVGSVTPIQVIQPVARKPVTAGAVADFTVPHLLTVLDSACDAGFRFDAVVASATGACLLLSRVCATETTVHSTGGNQRRSDRICLC